MIDGMLHCRLFSKINCPRSNVMKVIATFLFKKIQKAKLKFGVGLIFDIFPDASDSLIIAENREKEYYSNLLH